MDIGKRIKKRRLELGMTQDELAKASGYKWRSSINKIELGGQSIPQIQIEKIARALKVTPSYLVGWDEDMHFDDEGRPWLTAEITAMDEEVFEKYYNLSPASREIILANIDTLLQMESKRKE